MQLKPDHNWAVESAGEESEGLPGALQHTSQIVLSLKTKPVGKLYFKLQMTGLFKTGRWKI